MMYTKITAVVHMMHVCRVSSVVQASKVSGDMEWLVTHWDNGIDHGKDMNVNIMMLYCYTAFL